MSHLSLLMAAMTAYFTLSGSNMAMAHDGIFIEDAYVRVSGEGAKSAAVFMTLTNHSIEGDRLLSVASDAAERAELHTHKMDADGVMHMGEVAEGFAIAGQDIHMLERAGDHIMLLGLKHPLKQGDSVTMTLTFARGEVLTIKAQVDNDRKPGAAVGNGTDAMGGMAMPATN